MSGSDDQGLTERAARLAAVIEAVQTEWEKSTGWQEFGQAAYDAITKGLGHEDSAAVLREVRAEAVMAFATHCLKADGWRLAKQYANRIREGNT